MDLFAKLELLTDSAKYDVACTSSGVDRTAKRGQTGSAASGGCCHSFAADGRCISLLKVLLTNHCIFDCKYCVNRKSNDVRRAMFSPRELADLTMHFYRRNYIEGLFLSSGVVKSPDYTCELMIEALRILRREYHFSGYIHAKAIPGAADGLLTQLGLLADRMSVNIEMPSGSSLKLLCPDKTKEAVLNPMGFIRDRKRQNTQELALYKHAPRFAPAGQSTQMIIGASPETDFQILNLAEGLYKKYQLKRVFFSAYIPVVENSLLPSVGTKPPLLREHRLYQADWLLRYYHFTAWEILDEQHQTFNPFIDPKCNWALCHMEYFPVEVNRASYEELLRVPGVGVTSARRILSARRTCALTFEGLKKLGVVLKRAKYFITCRGKMEAGTRFSQEEVLCAMMSQKTLSLYRQSGYSADGSKQVSFFEPPAVLTGELQKCLSGQM